jgi:hypothetical protein
MPKYDIDQLNDKYKQKIVQSNLESEPSQPTTPKREVSQLESALRGGARGLTFGFSPKATAFLENILQGKDYEKSLQETLQLYKEAEEANPVTYTGSEIAGAIAPALVTGGGSTPLTLSRLATLSTIEGGIRGLGYSEGQNIKEKVKDISAGAVLGGAFPVVGRGFTKAIQSIKPAADVTIKAGITAATGKGSQYLEKLERNPEQIKRIEKVFTESAPEEVSKLSNQLTSLVEKDPFARKAQLYSRNAYKILDKEKDNIKVDRNTIFDYLKNKANTLNNSISEVEQNTGGELLKKANDIQKIYPEVMDGRQTKKLIQQIDKDIKALKPGQGKQLPINAQNKLEELSDLRQFIDTDLKTQSPNYAEAMKPVADATNVSSYLDRLKSSVFGGKQADPNLARKYIENKLASGKKNINLLPEENKTINLLETELQRKKYNNIPDIDKFRNLTQTINDLNLYKEMEATGAIGSNITNRYLATFGGGGGALGTALGMSVGGTPGAIVGGGIGTALSYPLGATLGAQAEKRGGQIAKQLLDVTRPIREGQVTPLTQQAIESTVRATGSPMLNDFLKTQADIKFRENEMKKRGAK